MNPTTPPPPPPWQPPTQPQAASSAPPAPTPWQQTTNSVATAPAPPGAAYQAPGLGNELPGYTPPPKSSMSKGAKWTIGIFATVVIVGFVIAAVLVGRAVSGFSTVENLAPGECVSDFFDESTDEVFLVETVDCELPHAYEVFAKNDLWTEGETYPGDDASYTASDDYCWEQYHEFVGGDYYESDYDFWTFYPTPESWDLGDRSAICLVGNYDGVTLLEGTLRGADA